MPTVARCNRSSPSAFANPVVTIIRCHLVTLQASTLLQDTRLSTWTHVSYRERDALAALPSRAHVPYEAQKAFRPYSTKFNLSPTPHCACKRKNDLLVILLPTRNCTQDSLSTYQPLDIESRNGCNPSTNSNCLRPSGSSLSINLCRMSRFLHSKALKGMLL